MEQSQDIAAGQGQKLSEPATRFGNTADEVLYMQKNATLAAPSLFNTNSRFLNNSYYRDTYAQIALRRNGPDVPSTYIIPLAARAIGEVTDYAEFQALIEAEKRKNPEFADWCAARRCTSFRCEDLEGSATGTLAHAIWELLGIEGIEMELQMKGVEPANDIDYISKRRGIVHDIEHIVTGFDANNCGELALIWSDIASLYKYFTPELAHHMSAGLTFLATSTVTQYSLHYHGAFSTTMDAVRLGIEMGQALKRPLLLEPWEDMLDWQLDDIAAQLGITRGPGKAWDWTSAATTG